jgi:hypothetical protein
VWANDRRTDRSRMIRGETPWRWPSESAGANMVQISLNRGAMPHEMFIEQIRRFAKEVPALHAHEVKRVPAAEMTA